MSGLSPPGSIHHSPSFGPVELETERLAPEGGDQKGI